MVRSYAITFYVYAPMIKGITEQGEYKMSAYTAEDAITQFKIEFQGKSFKIVKIRPERKPNVRIRQKLNR